MATYDVGIVGCGGMGRAHASTYRDVEGTTVAAAADTHQGTRSSFAEEYGVSNTYDDHGAMLEAEDPDVVSICTWHSTHARIAVDACEAGVGGIYCEKPMCISLGEAEDMLDAADRNDVRLTVGHQRRFDPVHERAVELIADGAIGQPLSATAAKGSGLINWGTHMVDLTRFLLDDPGYEWVMGQVERDTDRYERKVPVEDRCLGHVCFADGTRLTYESDLPDSDTDAASLRVAGSDGVLAIDLGSSVTVVNDDGTATYEPESGRSNRHRYVEALLEWTAGERENHRCSGARGRATMEVMMAIYESARTGGLVEAPLRTRANPLIEMIEAGDLPVEHPGRYDIRLPYASLEEE
jgi:predicted dehydrogenase